MTTRFGNFCQDLDAFDHAFFHISPREARSMDPQQRLLLRGAYNALENAGYVPYASPTFNPKTFASYIGVAANDYVLNLRNNIDVYYSTGKFSYLCHVLRVKTSRVVQELYTHFSAARYPTPSVLAALRCLLIQHVLLPSSPSTRRVVRSVMGTVMPP